MWEDKTDRQAVYTEGVGYDSELYVVTLNGCEYAAEMDFEVSWLSHVECIHLKSPSAWIWHRVVWEMGTYEYKRLGGTYCLILTP